MRSSFIIMLLVCVFVILLCFDLRQKFGKIRIIWPFLQEETVWELFILICSGKRGITPKHLHLKLCKWHKPSFSHQDHHHHHHHQTASSSSSVCPQAWAGAGCRGRAVVAVGAETLLVCTWVSPLCPASSWLQKKHLPPPLKASVPSAESQGGWRRTWTLDPFFASIPEGTKSARQLYTFSLSRRGKPTVLQGILLSLTKTQHTVYQRFPASVTDSHMWITFTNEESINRKWQSDQNILTETI